MVGSSALVTRPPFVGIKARRVNHKLVLCFVIGCSSFDALYVGPMAYLGLSIAAQNITIVNQWHPFFLLVLIGTVFKSSSKQAPMIRERWNALVVPEPISVVWSCSRVSKNLSAHLRYFVPKIVHLLEPSHLFLSLRHLVKFRRRPKLRMLFPQSVAQLDHVHALGPKESIGQVDPVKVAIVTIFNKLFCYDLPFPTAGELLLSSVG